MVERTEWASSAQQIARPESPSNFKKILRDIGVIVKPAIKHLAGGARDVLGQLLGQNRSQYDPQEPLAEPFRQR
jgi:hypothetical protein